MIKVAEFERLVAGRGEFQIGEHGVVPFCRASIVLGKHWRVKAARPRSGTVAVAGIACTPCVRCDFRAWPDSVLSRRVFCKSRI